MGPRALIGFESAREFWRGVGQRIAASNPADEHRRPLLIRLLFDDGAGLDLAAMPGRTRVTSAPARLCRADATCLVREGLLDEEVHLCVSKRGARSFVTGARVHLTGGTYPTGSFCEAEDGTLVTSPELTFFQMVRVLDMRKGNALAAEGWTVIVVDRSMLASVRLADELAKAVSRALGLGWLRPSRRIATAQLRLRNKLLADLDA